MNILHRDLKSANLFLYNSEEAKIGDLNVSKIVKEELNYTQTGTPYYASPEVWNDLPYNFKSDIWSLGCIIYELTSLELPFQASSMDALYETVQKGNFQKIPEGYSCGLERVISVMLEVNPDKRPT